MAVTISEGEVDVGGVGVFYRGVAGEGLPTVFVHGNPTDSRQWLPFLERMRGPALALDLPGWGRSARPPRDRFDYSMHGLAAIVEGFLKRLEVGDYRLVAQDWGGGISLIAAQKDPARLEALALMDSVPLLPGYRWHRLGVAWRTRGVGEALNASLSRPLAALGLREARAGHRAMTPEMVEIAWSNLRDRVTRSAILELYRSGDPPLLARAGERLGAVACPALVLWGARDPYIPARFAEAYARRLGGPTEVEILDDAGHWPWIDRPDVVDRVVGFLDQT